MPKIRKKTSKRGTTHLREKVKKKVSEAKRKQKKTAKKDITWKSNRKEQDLGIPSKFPFKDQILAEAAQAKIRREQDKLLRREQQKAAHQAASLGLPDPSLAALADSANPYADDDEDGFETMSDGDDSDMDEDEEEVGISASLRLHARSLRDVIGKSDVIVQVLDARDPEGTRSRKIEREAVQVHGKKLVLVLNKIDLVPKENVEAWLKHLRLSFPTLPFKSSTQSQRTNLSSGNTSHTPAGASSTSPSPLLTLLKNYSRSGSLTIGVIGFPNVGKSSLINTLKRSKACAVAPTPGFTKEVQVVSLDGSLKILDCPGVVYEGGDSNAETMLRNCVAVEKIVDPTAPVEVILRKCRKEHLMMLYNIPAFTDAKDFLIGVARSRGRLKKGGVPDLPGSAKMVLRDWNAGRIPYYTVPPAVPTGRATHNGTASAGSSTLRAGDDIGSAAIVTSLAPEFSLDDLFNEADTGALSDLKTSQEMGPGSSVRLNESIAVDEDAGNLQLLGENIARLDGDDAEEDDEDITMASVVAKSTKRRRAEDAGQQVVSMPPHTKQKKVAFQDTANNASSSQTAKMFGDGSEAPVHITKNAKQLAKADKKRKAKVERKTGRDIDDAAMALATSSLGSLEANTSNAAPRPYDFASFFGAPQAVPDEDEDM